MALALSLAFTACHCGAKDATPSAAATSANEPMPIFHGDTFSIRMPGEPAIGPTQVATYGGAAVKLRMISYTDPKKFPGATESTRYDVLTFDFPTVPAAIAPHSLLYDTVHDEMLKGLSAVVESDVPSTVYGHDGHEVELRRPSINGIPGSRISGRIFTKGSRMYMVSVSRPPDALPPAAVRDYLDSFELNGK